MSVARKLPGRFHHGDLRRALLDAVAEIVLEAGPEGVSLRECARRAGVAHSAAAPHFGDKRGLLTAFAAEGYARLGAAQEAAMAAAAPDPRAQLAGSGRGYIAFSRGHPGHFRLMFRADLLDNADPALRAARGLAAAPIERAIAAVLPHAGAAERQRRFALAWSVAHGFAALLADGVGPKLCGDRPETEAAEALVEDLVAACG